MNDLLFIIGSESDKAQVEPGIALAAEKGLSCNLVVYSAHRNLRELTEFLEKEEKNYKVIITAAGLSAALPGVVAAMVKKTCTGHTAGIGPSCRNGCAAVYPAASQGHSMRYYGNWKTGRPECNSPCRADYQLPELISANLIGSLLTPNFIQDNSGRNRHIQ